MDATKTSLASTGSSTHPVSEPAACCGGPKAAPASSACCGGADATTPHHHDHHGDHHGHHHLGGEGGKPLPAASAIDPVCGMTVDPGKTAHKAEHGGQTYYFCCAGCRSKFLAEPERHASAAAASPQVIDPVCGMTVDPAKTPHKAEHGGKTHYFCSAGCRTKFLAEPDRYLATTGDRAKSATRGVEVPVSPGAIYTCPMHPEIRQVGPGSCPICGMALEPVEVTAEAAPNPELADMTRRFWIGAVLAAPVFALEMGRHLAGLGHLVPGTIANWIGLALATPVVLWAGWPFLVRGWVSVRTGQLNMFTLIAMGTSVAWIYSVVATLAPGLLPAAVREHDGSAPVYFEAAAVIVVLVLLGQVLELRARERTSGAIRALLRLQPKTARRVRADGTDEDVPLEEVTIGDRLRVRPGEQVPVDGAIVDGRSAIDESLVTGESMPVTKAAGDAVIGGTLNGSGALVMVAEKVGRETLLARIVVLVADAQRSRAPIQRLADVVASWFVPAVILVAVLAFVAWLILGPEPRFAHALVASIAVLIIACPCALGLATPMAIMVGVGRGAAVGVLVRDAAALERLGEVDTLVVDKTGTLTAGRPAVTAILPAPGVGEADLLRLAASVERASEHPIAAAIVAEAGQRKLSLAEARAVESPVGRGIRGEVEGRRVVVGSPSFLGDEGIDPSSLAERAGRLRAEGATVVVVGIDGAAAGVIAVADPIKPTTPAAIAALKDQGLRVVMLTGDDRATAMAVAGKLGIEEIEANVLPDAKAAVIARLKGEGRVVAMAGDGVNDAPALAAADVGIAMGTGTDIAMESAGVTLVGGDLAGIVRARRLSRATMRNIRQNLFLAFAYNTAGVPIAAGVLYPIFGLLLSPIVAAAAMSLSSVSVIANALRLRSLDLSIPRLEPRD